METKILKIEKQLKQQRIITLCFGVLCGLFILSSFRNNHNTDIIRTTGIVIVDSMGNERILIGAPIPYAKNRVRTDLNRVQKEWGKQMSPQYMNWYQDYNNSANGIVFLDENGFDRVAIGESTPDPNIGKRIGPQTGIIVNDEHGFERSGYGLLLVEGKNRVVLGLDRHDGTEGVTLSILEDGTTGFGMMHNKKFMFMGHAAKDGLPVSMKKDLFGLIITDTSSVKVNLNAVQ